jgi:hypothetical protein
MPPLVNEKQKPPFFIQIADNPPKYIVIPDGFPFLWTLVYPEIGKIRWAFMGESP